MALCFRDVSKMRWKQFYTIFKTRVWHQACRLSSEIGQSHSDDFCAQSHWSWKGGAEDAKTKWGIGVLASEIVEKWKMLVINEEHKRLERCPSKKRSDIEINTIVSAYKFGSSGLRLLTSWGSPLSTRRTPTTSSCSTGRAERCHRGQHLTKIWLPSPARQLRQLCGWGKHKLDGLFWLSRCPHQVCEAAPSVQGHVQEGGGGQLRLGPAGGEGGGAGGQFWGAVRLVEQQTYKGTYAAAKDKKKPRKRKRMSTKCNLVQRQLPRRRR